MAEHDGGYKLLFSHPKMVEDLLRGFVRESWVEDLDFTTLERVNENFTSEDLQQRHSDMVWRLGWTPRRRRTSPTSPPSSQPFSRPGTKTPSSGAP